MHKPTHHITTSHPLILRHQQMNPHRPALKPCSLTSLRHPKPAPLTIITLINQSNINPSPSLTNIPPQPRQDDANSHGTYTSSNPYTEEKKIAYEILKIFVQLTKEDEALTGSEDNEVRREDQEKINRFSRLHQRETLLEEQLKLKMVCSSLLFILSLTSFTSLK